MTVCIAAICTIGKDLMIVGASDRMLSAPDVKYEPPQRKAYEFFPWVQGLIAGDPYAQVTICNRTSAYFRRKPPNTVEEVALAYADEFSRYRRQMAEARFLKPIGLDVEALLERQGDFPRDFVNGLKLDLQGTPIEVETIITGIDATGPHIFVVTDPGIPECHDALSFAAVGSGKNHATSQFMLARYSRFDDYRKALMLSFIAKKRSEVAPTVGTTTDLFFIMGHNRGGAFTSDLSEEVRKEFELLYFELEQNIDWFTRDAFHKAGAFIDSEARRHTQPQETHQQPLPESKEPIPPPPEAEPPAIEASPAPKKRSPRKRKTRGQASKKPAT